MTQFYQKNELGFSLLWIAAYIVSFSFADNLSRSLGIEKIITAPLCIFFVVFLWCWIKKRNLSEKYGLCKFQGDIKKYLYFIPLVLIMTCNLWNGVALNRSVAETVLYVLSMLCVGWIEEVIFRGFLFKAICKDGVKQAILIASVTFGIGHIVNLLDGAEMFSTLLQICYAVAIGFLFTIIFYKGGSLLPCIIAHSFVNALSAFKASSSQGFHIATTIILSVVSIGYAIWIIKKGAQNTAQTPI